MTQHRLAVAGLGAALTMFTAIPAGAACTPGVVTVCRCDDGHEELAVCSEDGRVATCTCGSYVRSTAPPSSPTKAESPTIADPTMLAGGITVMGLGAAGVVTGIVLVVTGAFAGADCAMTGPDAEPASQCDPGHAERMGVGGGLIAGGTVVALLFGLPMIVTGNQDVGGVSAGEGWAIRF
jgi:hypothetical protein